MKFTTYLLLFLSFTLFACSPNSPKKEVKESASEIKNTKPNFINKAHEMVYESVQKTNSLNMFDQKKDVTYTYSYVTGDGLADIATEKYIFEGELSYGKYKKHKRTLANLEGVLEQGYDGKNYWCKVDGKPVEDEKTLNAVSFNRPTNYYWFTMMPKLLDPGLTYEYIGEKEVNDMSYDVVKVGFKPKDDKPTDIYQVYINKDTKLMDQWLFTVADFGMLEKPLLMKVQYEKVDDILIPTNRKYKLSTWEGEVTDEPWTTVRWTNVKFKNGFTAAEFSK